LLTFSPRAVMAMKGCIVTLADVSFSKFIVICG
jgi:hypothetical protein